MDEASPSTAAERAYFLELFTTVLGGDASNRDDLVQQLEWLARLLMNHQDASPELLLAEWLRHAL